MRIGILGCGNHSRSQHGPSLRQCARESTDVELVAACDLDRGRAETYASDFGFAHIHTDIRQMLEERQLDALVAVTPVELTYEIVGELLPFGTPLMIEKPPGRTSAEAADLSQRAKRYGTPVMVSFNRRFNPAVVEGRRWIEEKAPAPPAFISARMLRVGRTEAPFITATGIHLTDTVLSFAGRPVEVHSHRWQSVAGGPCCAAQVSFDSGIEGQLLMLPTAGRSEECYELNGPGYSVEIDAGETALDILVERHQEHTWRASPDMPDHERIGALNEAHAFFESVRGNRSFEPDLETAIASLALAERMEASP